MSIDFNKNNKLAAQTENAQPSRPLWGDVSVADRGVTTNVNEINPCEFVKYSSSVKYCRAM